MRCRRRLLPRLVNRLLFLADLSPLICPRRILSGIPANLGHKAPLVTGHPARLCRGAVNPDFSAWAQP